MSKRNSRTKVKQHYVPQFWLRGFADDKNKIHGMVNGRVRAVSSDKIMQEKWLYTLFDKRWKPTDILEDGLGRIEAQIAPVFEKIGHAKYVPTSHDRGMLVAFMGLQACRHPDILNRGYKRARELAKAFANVGSYKDLSAFQKAMSPFGIGPIDSEQIYALLITMSRDQLMIELQEIEGLSPQDPRLPIQDALRAFRIIACEIDKMNLELLEAPLGKSFVLGDTPLPQEKLNHGFVVPLSKTLALRARPASSGRIPMMKRQATAGEVDAINKMQYENALKLVIGPDPNVLKKLR
jgi:hypothetical protein